jgi:hypothetical protein
MSKLGCDWSDLTDSEKSEVVAAILEKLGLFISRSEYGTSINVYDVPKDGDAD